MKEDDSWTLGEVVKMCDEGTVLLRVFKKVTVEGYEDYSLWQDEVDERNVSKESVLPIRPETELVTALSTLSRYRRRIVVQVGNPEFIDSLCIM